MSEKTTDGKSVPSNVLLADAVWCLANVWREMNGIRARDGAPPGVSEKWWEELMDRCERVILAHTGKPAHCNPILYTANS